MILISAAIELPHHKRMINTIEAPSIKAFSSKAMLLHQFHTESTRAKIAQMGRTTSSAARL
jgi:hypothetical protein